MKALPKRKGNAALKAFKEATQEAASMKALPKRKGNITVDTRVYDIYSGLNESPSQKEGKYVAHSRRCRRRLRLNESPSQKEGK